MKWIDIKEYEGYYQINENGLIRRVNKNSFRFKKSVLDKDGYECVNLSKDKIIKGFKIHRLIAQHFIANPNNLPEVNHKNGIKNDNTICNLEWSDRSYNIKHAYDIGLKNHNWMNDLVKEKMKESRLKNAHLYKRNKLGQYENN